MPDLRSLVPSEVPPLPPLAALGAGEQAAKDALTARNRWAHQDRTPVPPGVWIVAVDKLHMALRPTGTGRVELWDGRCAPVGLGVARVRRNRLRRSRLTLHLTDGSTVGIRTLNPGSARAAHVGTPAETWRDLGGPGDELGLLIAVAAGLVVTLLSPWLAVRAARRARVATRLSRALTRSD